MVTQFLPGPATRLLFLTLTACAPAIAADDALAHANRLLSQTILIDGHNDLPITIRGEKCAPGTGAASDLRGRSPGPRTAWMVRVPCASEMPRTALGSTPSATSDSVSRIAPLGSMATECRRRSGSTP